VATAKIPGTTVTLSIERVAARPFLAEYKRTLVVARGQDILTKFKMDSDTGGTVLVNLYRISDKSVSLVDRLSTYFVNMELGEVTRRNSTIEDEEQGQFLGAFDVTEAKDWRYFPSSERAKRPIPHRMSDSKS